MSLAACLLGAALAGAAEPPTGGVTLELPGGKTPCLLRVAVEGETATPWAAFLDELFTYFDADGDGTLSRKEAERMFPLPLPAGKALTVAVKEGGKLSREQFKAYCRANGFAPVVATLNAPTTDDLCLGAVFAKGIDVEALRKWDLNEDEYLDRDELLEAAPAAPPAPPLKAKLADGRADVVLRLRADSKSVTPAIDGADAKSCRLVVSEAGDLHRLYGPRGQWMVGLRGAPSAADIGSATEFLLAQFKDALGKRAALAKADVEQDPALGALEPLFPHADRDGDGKLTTAELERYLKLVEQGVRCQVWVRVSDRGGNLLPCLDADGDGRLSYRELLRAAEVLKGGALPHPFEVALAGPTVKSWGGVQLPVRRERVRPPEKKAATGPRWFQALDRNGDGVVTPREFLGPPEAFRKLDQDGDGVISAEEAARAEKR